ncbi:MAG: L-threonylcarbamoyladenylate synthase [Gammaproteobacteria bacterium]
MAQFFHIHPVNPQLRLIRQAAEIVRAGGVIAYPTDSSYALGCRIGDRAALERIQTIRQTEHNHYFTLVCRDLSALGTYARVDNHQFRLLKRATPGPFTFILRASHETPRHLQHPKRKTIGIRVPDHAIVRALLDELGEPILSSTLILPGDELPLNDADAIRDQLDRQLELVIDGGPCSQEYTTVLDLTDAAPVLLRQGKGDASAFL